MSDRELGHVYLFVSDIEKSRKFYTEVIGLTELPLTQPTPFKQAVFVGGTGRTHHELYLGEVMDTNPAPVPPVPRLGLNHIGFKIGDTHEELLEAYRNAKTMGVTLVAASDHGHTHSLHLLDPDGVQVEVYVDLKGPFWQSDPASFVAAGSVDNPLPLDGELLPQQRTFELVKSR